jgi:hypothetical protein
MSRDSKSSPASAPTLSRRTVFAGAGLAGAAAAVAVVLPQRQALPGVPESSASAADGAGYRLTEHVRRYYQTARV